MTKYTLFLLSIVLFVTSCSEQIPPGINPPGGINPVNSSYIAPVEAKQDKVVLIEELTGVACANCPKAADVIKDIEKNNPERIISVALHPASVGWTDPHFGKSKYNF